MRSFGGLIGCVWKILGLNFELCRGRNFIEWADKGFGGLERTPSILKAKERKKIRKKGTRKLLKRCEIDRLTVVKSWKKRGNMYLGLITSYAWLWKVKMCTLINDRYYVRRRYKVSSNKYGRRRKAKMQNTKWAIDLRFKKKN